MHFHKFPSIEALVKKAQLFDGLNVVITEKIDGTSFRFQIYRDGTFKCGSRNQEIGADSKFYADRPFAFVQGKMNRGEFSPVWARVGDHVSVVTFYGEWAGQGVMSRINYGALDFYTYMVMIDDYVCARSELDLLCKAVGLKTVPLLKSGKFNFVEMDKFLEIPSVLAPGKKTEGFVVWSDPVVRDQYGDIIFAKHKNEDWAEVKPKNKVSADIKAGMLAAICFADQFVTKGRIHNVLSHGDFIVDGSMKDMQHLVRLLPRDIEKEAPEEIEALVGGGTTKAQITTAITNKTAAVYKEMLKEKVSQSNAMEY